MNRYTKTVRSRIGGLLAALLLVLTAIPVSAQMYADGPDGDLKAQYLIDIEAMETKFLALAGAMDAESYTWSPMEGVRSVSQVFMLMAGECYVIPNAWNAEPSEELGKVEVGLFNEFAQITDKEMVLEHLRNGFTYYKEVINALTEEDMARTITFFGADRTVQESLFLMSGDMHEHLGQAIAYARANHVVPPWSAGGGD